MRVPQKNGWLKAIAGIALAAFAVMAGACPTDNGTASKGPKTPSNVKATAISENSITVSWATVSGADIRYIVYFGTSKNGYFSSIASTPSTSYTHTMLAPDTTHYYRVSAFDGINESPQSATVSATTASAITAPGVPSNVTAATSPESTSNITVNWSVVSGAVEYRVYRSTNYDGPFSQIGVSSSTSYTDTGLVEDTGYYYRVSAYNGSTESAQSYIVFATTGSVPDVPADISATVESESSITISWSGVSGTVSYRVYRSTGENGSFSLIGVSSSTSYTDTGLAAVTTYYYRVSAYNYYNYKESSQSSAVSATTALGVPSYVEATVYGNSIVVRWSWISETVEAVEYRVYRSTSEDGPFSLVGYTSSTSYIDTGLAYITGYYYRVSAYDGYTEGYQSSVVFATTRRESITEPLDVTITAVSSSSLMVSWSEVFGAEGYEVLRWSSGGYQVIASTSSTSYTDTGLTYGTVYIYSVIAYNDVSRSFSQQAIMFLSVPSDVTATADSADNITGSITVNWSAVPEAAEYHVYRDSSGGSVQRIASTSSTSHTDTNLTGNTIYNYRVSAYNVFMESAQSAPVSEQTIPGAPNVLATTGSERHIAVSWSGSSGVTGHVYRSTSEDGSYDLLARSNSGFSDYGLSANTTYYYKVSLSNSAGEGLQSAVVSATTAPDIPLNMAATAESESSITVSWSEVSEATEYRVYRGTSSDGTFSQIASTASTSYTVTGLSLGVTYYYRVSARNDNGESNRSSVVTARTILRVPANVSATASLTDAGIITISWSAVPGAAGYRVYRSSSEDGSYSQIGSSSSTSYTNTGLTAGATYYYKVSAYWNSIESSQSSAVSATTGSGAPGVPSDITAAAASANSITISWVPVPDATGYEVYRSTSENGSYTRRISTSSTSFTDTGLEPGTDYYYKVLASNSYGASSQSAAVSAITNGPPNAPGVPKNVTTTVESYSSVTISWSEVSEAYGGYRVYRSTSSTGIFSQIGSTSSITSTSYTDTDLTRDATYYYRVAASNAFGESAKSPAVSATMSPPAAAPAIPSNVSMNNNITSVTISWSAVFGATGYRIYRSTSYSDGYSEIGSALSTSYTNENLPYNMIYYYKVSAYNSYGESAQSYFVSGATGNSGGGNSGGGTVGPVIPSGVTATATSPRSVMISWSEVPEALEYRVYRSLYYDRYFNLIGVSSSTSYTDLGLYPSTDYYYRVSAYSSYGTSSLSSAIPATTYPDPSAPGFPSNVTVTVNSGRDVTISWSPVSGADYYFVYFSTNSDNYGKENTTHSTSCTFNGMTSGATYYIRIAAWSGVVRSGLSPPVSVTIP